MAGKQSKTLSRRAQGEETRATLIDVGARLFAQKGYDGVSMRTLAAEAGVNLATVGYHFGGKPGLYQAIMEEIIAVRHELFPEAQEVRERLTKAGDDVRAKCAVSDWFVGQIVRELLGNSEYAWPAFIVSRELAQPSEWYDKLEHEFFQPSFESLCALVSGVVAPGTRREEVVLTAHCLIGTVTKIMEAQGAIARRLGWDDLSEHIDLLETIITKRARGLLGLPMEDAR
jgi:AcrR family transcriptional regulator